MQPHRNLQLPPPENSSFPTLSFSRRPHHLTRPQRTRSTWLNPRYVTSRDASGRHTPRTPPPRRRHNQVCFVRHYLTWRTKHTEKAGASYKRFAVIPRGDLPGLVARDAVTITVQLGAIPRFALVHRRSASRPRGFAVGVVGTVLLWLRYGRRLGFRSRLTATTLTVRLRCRLGFRSNRLRRGFGRRSGHRQTRRRRGCVARRRDRSRRPRRSG